MARLSTRHRLASTGTSTERASTGQAGTEQAGTEQGTDQTSIERAGADRAGIQQPRPGIGLMNVTVWVLLLALIVSLPNDVGVTAAGRPALVLLILAGVVFGCGYGVIAVRRLGRRLRPPASRGGRPELRQAADPVVGRLVSTARALGAVAGLTHGQASDADTVSYGGPAGLDDQTVLEVGSIAKVITGILLADLVTAGVVALDTDAGAILGLDQLDGITLFELATHRSGLPRLPRGPRLRALIQHPDPYRRTDVRRLLRTMPRPSASVPTYSNLGYAVLGAALAKATGGDYRQLAAERVLLPLGMTSSGFDIPLGAVGHDSFGMPVSSWHQAAFAPAGGLRSTVSDLLALASATVRAPDGPLGAALALATTAQAPFRRRSIGLGWMLGDGVAYHNGRTRGMYAWVGADRARGRGVALITTSESRRGGFDKSAREFLRAIP